MTPTHLYIMRGTVTGRIKIGISRNPKSRLRDINNACSERCELVAVLKGAARLEKALHKAFARYQVHGEWFENDGDVWRWVSAVQRAGPSAKIFPLPSSVALGMRQVDHLLGRPERP